MSQKWRSLSDVKPNIFKTARTSPIAPTERSYINTSWTTENLLGLLTCRSRHRRRRCQTRWGLRPACRRRCGRPPSRSRPSSLRLAPGPQCLPDEDKRVKRLNEKEEQINLWLAARAAPWWGTWWRSPGCRCCTRCTGSLGSGPPPRRCRGPTARTSRSWAALSWRCSPGRTGGAAGGGARRREGRSLASKTEHVKAPLHLASRSACNKRPGRERS